MLLLFISALFVRYDVEGDLFVGQKILQSHDQLSSYYKYLLGIVLLSHFIEELDNVREVHVPVEDDVSVVFHHGKGHKQKELTRYEKSRSPNCLPNKISVAVGKYSLEIEKKPPRNLHNSFHTSLI